MTYEINFYKTENLTPDELNAKRSNAAGVWLHAGTVEAGSSQEAIKIARSNQQEKGWLGNGCKLQAVGQ